MRELVIQEIRCSNWYKFLVRIDKKELIPDFKNKSDTELVKLLQFASVWDWKQENIDRLK